MKVIDLLNKMANNEELPKRIRYNGDEWKLGISENETIDYLKYDLELFNQYLEYSLIESLNDKVEILENEEIDIQEIEEIKTLGCNIETKDGMIIPTVNLACDYIINKINEIIRVVNKMQQESKIRNKSVGG